MKINRTMIRSIEEILKEAESTNDLQTLINLWNEIVKNKKQYALAEIEIANEKIRELALKSNGEDFQKWDFYLFLQEQSGDFGKVQLDFDFARELEDKVVDSLTKNFENIIIEGLKRKGIEFDDKNELFDFAKENLSCLRRGDSITYYLNNIPFVIIKYKLSTLSLETTEREFNYEADVVFL